MFNPKTVLIVEGEATRINFVPELKELLDNSGYETGVAYGPVEARHYLTAHNPFIVILIDEIEPDVFGDAFVKELNELSEDASTNICIVHLSTEAHPRLNSHCGSVFYELAKMGYVGSVFMSYPYDTSLFLRTFDFITRNAGGNDTANPA